MLKRRVPRVLSTGLLMAVAVSGLSACRSSPTVAAYVGDGQVTVTELQSALDERRSDPDVDAFAEANSDDFSRRVLTLLVQEEVYSAAAARYDVEVGDDDVRARIDQLLGEDDPDTVFGQLAAQGIARADVFENVRQQMVLEQIAIGEGKAEGLTEAGLRAAYEEMRTSRSTVRFGYITVPDQATATAVLAQLTATPESYAAVAAQYAGQYTLAEVAERSPDQLPPPLADQAVAAEPGTGFTVAVPEVGGVVVGFVAPYPAFEELRPELEQQAAGKAAEAAAPLIEDVRADLDVTVNPRFGVLEDGQLVPGGNDVVQLLDEDASAAGPDTGGN